MDINFITKSVTVTRGLPEQVERIQKLEKENQRLRNVVALLIEYEEHDENILKGAVMWEALIEAAHRALMEKP